MRRVLALCVLCLLLTAPAAAAAADSVPGRVVVGFEPGTGAALRADVRADAGARLLDTLGEPTEQVLRVEGDPARVAAALERRAGVAYAEPDRPVRAQWTPDDPLLGLQWGLGASSVPAGWDLARGSGVLVGIVDTGADLGHPDLGRFWTNPAEVPANGVDDDRDGLVDDVHGYDFANDDADPGDDQGHGTSVTGVIAAGAQNGTGVAGVAPEASVIQAKALRADGSGSSSAVAAGLRFLASHGARVVNLSLGGPWRAQSIASAIADHPGTLFVVAAGNDGADVDAAGTGSWPCNEPAPNVLCVAASRRGETRAAFSNWGATSVDLVAPGEGIATTARGGGYVSASGTSFSAPMVTGAAALLFSRRPAATAADVRAALLATAAPVADYRGITATGGRLDVAAALGAIAAGGGTAPLPPALPAAGSAAPVATAPTAAPRPAATPAPTPTATAKAKARAQAKARAKAKAKARAKARAAAKARARAKAARARAQAQRLKAKAGRR